MTGWCLPFATVWLKSRPVQIGQRNAEFAELQSGLSEGDAVIMHPGDNIAAGVAVVERAE